VMASGNMLDRIAGGDATYAVFSFYESVAAGRNVYLKDSDGSVCLHHYADNSYRYLLLTCDDLAAGDYTMWLENVQLGHGGTMMGGNGFGGGRGAFGAQFPEAGKPPEMEGMERPEGFEPPQMNGMEHPEGFETPERNGSERPEGMGNRGFGDMVFDGGEKSEIFTIADGGNQFGRVAPI